MPAPACAALRRPLDRNPARGPALRAIPSRQPTAAEESVPWGPLLRFLGFGVLGMVSLSIFFALVGAGKLEGSNQKAGACLAFAPWLLAHRAWLELSLGTEGAARFVRTQLEVPGARAPESAIGGALMMLRGVTGSDPHGREVSGSRVLLGAVGVVLIFPFLMVGTGIATWALGL